MSILLLALLILTAGLNVFISVGGKTIDDSWKHKRDLLLIVGCLLFMGLVGVGVVTFRDNRRVKEQAKKQSESLNANIVSLKDENLALADQNKKLVDQSADCNARVEALTTKFRTPVHFKRGISETLKTQDAVEVK